MNGKQALEREWHRPSAVKGAGLGNIVEDAIQLDSLDDLRELARTVEVIRGPRIASIADIDREIKRLEQRCNPQNRADVEKRLERTRSIRAFAADHDLLPAEAPKPAYERKPRSDSRLRPKRGHRSEPQRHSNPSHKSVSHDRGGYAR